VWSSRLPTLRTDGGYDVFVQIDYYGASRYRTVSCLPTNPGTQTLDGVPIASPPNEIKQLCSYLTATWKQHVADVQTQVASTLATPAAQTLVAGP
jgi:hypothetical protein